jgi:hypothetical protein
MVAIRDSLNGTARYAATPPPPTYNIRIGVRIKLYLKYDFVIERAYIHYEYIRGIRNHSPLPHAFYIYHQSHPRSFDHVSYIR